MVKCVGYQYKQGIFEDDKGKSVPYDNILIHYVSDNNEAVYGLEAQSLKLKRSDFLAICDVAADSLIDRELILSYNPVGGKLVLTRIEVI